VQIVGITVAEFVAYVKQVCGLVGSAAVYSMRLNGAIQAPSLLNIYINW